MECSQSNSYSSQRKKQSNHNYKFDDYGNLMADTIDDLVYDKYAQRNKDNRRNTKEMKSFCELFLRTVERNEQTKFNCIDTNINLEYNPNTKSFIQYERTPPKIQKINGKQVIITTESKSKTEDKFLDSFNEEGENSSEKMMNISYESNDNNIKNNNINLNPQIKFIVNMKNESESEYNKTEDEKINNFKEDNLMNMKSDITKETKDASNNENVFNSPPVYENNKKMGFFSGSMSAKSISNNFSNNNFSNRNYSSNNFRNSNYSNNQNYRNINFENNNTINKNYNNYDNINYYKNSFNKTNFQNNYEINNNKINNFERNNNLFNENYMNNNNNDNNNQYRKVMDMIKNTKEKKIFSPPITKTQTISEISKATNNDPYIDNNNIEINSINNDNNNYNYKILPVNSKATQIFIPSQQYKNNSLNIKKFKISQNSKNNNKLNPNFIPSVSIKPHLAGNIDKNLIIQLDVSLSEQILKNKPLNEICFISKNCINKNVQKKFYIEKEKNVNNKKILVSKVYDLKFKGDDDINNKYRKNIVNNYYFVTKQYIRAKDRNNIFEKRHLNFMKKSIDNYYNNFARNLSNDYNNINECSFSNNEDYFADDDNYDSDNNKFYDYFAAKNKLRKSKMKYYGYGNRLPQNIRIEIKNPFKNDIKKENKNNSDLENQKRNSNISIKKSQSCQKIIPKKNNESLKSIISDNNNQNKRKKLKPINSPNPGSYNIRNKENNRNNKWIKNREIIDAAKKERNKNKIDINNNNNNNKKQLEISKNKKNITISVKKINIKEDNEEETNRQNNNFNGVPFSKRKNIKQNIKDKKSSNESLKNYTNVIIEFPAIKSYFH